MQTLSVIDRETPAWRMARRGVHMSSLALVLITAALQAQSRLPAPALGPEQAPITVLVFSDFESFPCSRSAEVVWAKNSILLKTRVFSRTCLNGAGQR
jgi:hypothetical protein